MDLSIFDAFEKPASSSNSSYKRISVEKHDSESESKKKRTDMASSSSHDEETLQHVEVTVKVIESQKQSYIPAKEYKFKLDTFQQTAVDHIERGESVLVAAHTSAGSNTLIRK
jgi:superfamily II RNA helicase